MTKFLVAVDGPAGSGKSSVCREAARRLGFGFLDTGAAYRALAWATLHHPDIYDINTLDEYYLLPEFTYQISTDPNEERVVLFEEDITKAIRTPEVSKRAAEVAKFKKIREEMVELTRRIAKESFAVGMILEGRDITTVVAPNAPVRVLMTASPEVRAQRRAKDDSEAQSSVLEQLKARDYSDSEQVDFTTPAEGVTLLDTSELNFEQSVEALITLIKTAQANWDATADTSGEDDEAAYQALLKRAEEADD